MQALSILEIANLHAKENLIGINQACAVTGYKKSTLYKLVHKREIPFHKTPGRKPVYFYKSELLAWRETG